MRSCGLLILVIFGICQQCTAPPVTQNKSADGEQKENEVDGQETGLEDYMEYHRYLKEVVNALESDPKFREKLEKANETDIRSGRIAHELDLVSHKVRTRLDELKRTELERLRHLIKSKQQAVEHRLNYSQDEEKDKAHIDHENPHTFEIEDLKKLIKKSTQDLAEADKKRRQEFKEYEMQKEFEKQQKLKSLDEAQRLEFENQLKEQEEKHKKHESLHHPGSKQQLEEVWKEQDHMEQQEFDPRTFFMMHDLDGNGAWDENEVKTLFVKELDKMYREGAPEDDMRERIEEMERMREHVFKEVDKDRDGLISYSEFLAETKRPEFQEDQGWKPLDEQNVYSDDDYRKFEMQRIAEIQRLVSKGMLPPEAAAGLYDPLAQNAQFPPQYQPGQVPVPRHISQGQMPPQGQYQRQVPPQAQYQGQVPPQAQYQGQMPPQVQYQGQVPPPAQYQGQVPPPAQYQGQVPPPVQYQGQVLPPAQYQGQAPPHQRQGQLPQRVPYQGQVPPQDQYQGQVRSQGQHQEQAPPQVQHQEQVPPQVQPQHSDTEYQKQYQNNQINSNQIPQLKEQMDQKSINTHEVFPKDLQAQGNIHPEVHEKKNLPEIKLNSEQESQKQQI